MCGDPSMIPSLAGGEMALPDVQHCVLDPSLTCTFCDTCDGDLFQTFQLQTVSVRVPEYDMATGTVTALAPSTDLTTIDGTYLSKKSLYVLNNNVVFWTTEQPQWITCHFSPHSIAKACTVSRRSSLRRCSRYEKGRTACSSMAGKV